MKKTMIIIFLFVASLIFGCAGQQQLPESMSVPRGNRTAEELKNKIIARSMSDGWRIEKESEHTVSLIKENKNPAAQILLGSKFNSSVMWRLTINIMQTREQILISAHEDNVANYGSAFERTYSTNTGGEIIRKLKESYYEEVQPKNTETTQNKTIENNNVPSDLKLKVSR
jgi:hypothetical protein